VWGFFPIKCLNRLCCGEKRFESITADGFQHIEQPLSKCNNSDYKLQMLLHVMLCYVITNVVIEW